MLIGLMMLAAAAQAEPSSGRDDTLKRGGEIITQPVKDVGAAKIKIPPVLERAQDNP